MDICDNPDNIPRVPAGFVLNRIFFLNPVLYEIVRGDLLQRLSLMRVSLKHQLLLLIQPM